MLPSPRVIVILAWFLSLLLAATLFFWVHASSLPEYIAYSSDYRGITSPDSAFIGTRSFGLYAAPGRIGFFYHHDIGTAYEPAALSDPAPKPPARLLWDQSQDPGGGGYMGGLSLEKISDFQKWSHAGVTAYDGDDMGMSHDHHIAGYLIDDGVLITLLCALLLPILWKLRQPSRDRRKGLCPTCGYNLSAHLKAPISPRCPECGETIATA